MKRTSIVLPVYNESENISIFVRDIKKCIKKNKGYKFDIVVSDSHSTDGTSEIVKKMAKKDKRIHYIDGPRGIGMGIYNGIKYSLKSLKPDIVVQIDGDGQVDPGVILKLISAIEEGYDMAVGSRFVAKGKNNLPIIRKAFTFSSSIYCRVVMGPWKLREFTNSARAFTPQILKKIKWSRLPLKKQSFIMLPSQLHEAIEAGARFKEVPLVFNNRPHGYSKNKIFNYTIDLAMYALKVRISKMTKIFI